MPVVRPDRKHLFDTAFTWRGTFYYEECVVCGKRTCYRCNIHQQNVCKECSDEENNNAIINTFLDVMADKSNQILKDSLIRPTITYLE